VRNEVVLCREEEEEEERNVMHTMKRRRPVGLVETAVETVL
jgi:hypothetical protein